MMMKSFYISLILNLILQLIVCNGKDYPFHTLPSFDYGTLIESKERLITSLQDLGAITLKNIPNYVDLSNKVLASAGECIAKESIGVLNRTFHDGTHRYTISTNPKYLTNHVNCPEYLNNMKKFSELMNQASIQFGKALDATFEGPQEYSLEKIIRDSEKLDHSHAYAPNSKIDSRNQITNKHELTLDIHTDAGMFIAMVTPQYYKVDDDKSLTRMEDPDKQSGLVIMYRKNQLVRPILKHEELLIMIGEGFKRWLPLNFKNIEPVPHGVLMPRSPDLPNNFYRLWNGRMSLLGPNQIMKNTGITFGEFANATTRSLLGHEEMDASSVACPRGTRFLSSDTQCMHKICKSTVDDATDKQCYKWCNDGHNSKKCEKKCSCEGTTPGLECWMFCIPHLPFDECDKQSQTCNNDEQYIYCKKPPATFPPTTKPPTTSIPTTKPPTTSPPTTKPPTTTPPTTSPPTTTPPATTPPTTSPPTTKPPTTTPPTTSPPTTKPPTTSPPTTKPVTTSPTEDPTKPTTQSPTKYPTQPVSQSPTKDPTKPATQSPTKDPTKPATQSPTKDPTKPATQSPTKDPTKPATQLPTKDPTKPGTEPPTKDPSKEDPKPATTNPTDPSSASALMISSIAYILLTAAYQYQ